MKKVTYHIFNGGGGDIGVVEAGEVDKMPRRRKGQGGGGGDKTWRG